MARRGCFYLCSRMHGPVSWRDDQPRKSGGYSTWPTVHPWHKRAGRPVVANSAKSEVSLLPAPHASIEQPPFTILPLALKVQEHVHCQRAWHSEARSCLCLDLSTSQQSNTITACQPAHPAPAYASPCQPTPRLRSPLPPGRLPSTFLTPPIAATVST